MPIYEYVCDAEDGGCGHTFEEIQSFTDEALTKCPECKKKKLRKVFGNPGLIFKGAGFYCNDYPKEEAKSTEA